MNELLVPAKVLEDKGGILPGDSNDFGDMFDFPDQLMERLKRSEAELGTLKLERKDLDISFKKIFKETNKVAKDSSVPGIAPRLSTRPSRPRIEQVRLQRRDHLACVPAVGGPV
ncbi:hypothetical protein PTTG_04273 [Puccinia triticina 1-1 BBBD Race 1]|uniref:Uncharacterized protein n=1 Tax=Puccinia triticina (isolate 1-1 / race 1 (BBBD)) TaxID=630390 RepID=A0A0C4ETZ4_PUCT1|nr:hypothetical protein PTTG_04273 [Puccinia triticina 1-1 BBBD Race 1]